MRAMKWTSLTLMLMLAFSSVAQEEFFDDIYYSTKEKKEASKVETNVVKAKKVEAVKADNSEQVEAMSADERDVDEYNRRYSSDDVYAEEMQDEAAQEAKWVIERLHSESIDLPVVYDMEMYSDETNARGNTTTREQRTANAAVFLDNIANAGYSPMLYASTGTYDTVFDPQYLTGYPFWVAEYDTVCSYPYTYAMWQYSESRTLNGVSTNVDLDIRLIEK